MEKINDSIGQIEEWTIWLLAINIKWTIAKRFKGQLAKLGNKIFFAKGILKGKKIERKK